MQHHYATESHSCSENVFTTGVCLRGVMANVLDCDTKLINHYTMQGATVAYFRIRKQITYLSFLMASVLRSFSSQDSFNSAISFSDIWSRSTGSSPSADIDSLRARLISFWLAGVLARKIGRRKKKKNGI